MRWAGLVLAVCFASSLQLWAASGQSTTSSAAQELVSEAKNFTLSPLLSAGTTVSRQIWMTNYKRTWAALVDPSKGVVLLSSAGKPFTRSAADEVAVAISHNAFCSGANNSVIGVSTLKGPRIFGTAGPIPIQTADCTEIFQHGLSPTAIYKINHQSFVDITSCAPFGLDALGHALIPFRSVAVLADGSIPLNSVLFIPSLVGASFGDPRKPMHHDGYFVAVDTVDSGNVKPGLPETFHVDVFMGDQQDFLGATSEHPDLSFKLLPAKIIVNSALKQVLLHRPSC